MGRVVAKSFASNVEFDVFGPGACSNMDKMQSSYAQAAHKEKGFRTCSLRAHCTTSRRSSFSKMPQPQQSSNNLSDQQHFAGARMHLLDQIKLLTGPNQQSHPPYRPYVILDKESFFTHATPVFSHEHVQWHQTQTEIYCA